jgi:hypothetical protein
VCVPTVENLLENSHFIDAYVGFMRALVPSVDRFEKISDFPKLTGLVFSIQWSFSILYFFFMLWAVSLSGYVNHLRYSEAINRIPFLAKITVFLFMFSSFPFVLTDIGLLNWLGYYSGIGFVDQDFSKTVYSISHSKAALAVFSWEFSMAGAILYSLSMFMIYSFLAGSLKENNSGEAK